MAENLPPPVSHSTDISRGVDSVGGVQDATPDSGASSFVVPSGESDWWDQDSEPQSAYEIAEGIRENIASQITQELLLENGLIRAENAQKTTEDIQTRIAGSLAGKEEEVRKDNIAAMFVPAAKASAVLNGGEFLTGHAVDLLHVPRGSVEVAELLPALAQRWTEITSKISLEEWKSVTRHPDTELPRLLWVMVQPGNTYHPQITTKEQAQEVFGAMLSSRESVAQLISLGDFPKTALKVSQNLRNSNPDGQVDTSRVALTAVEIANQQLATDEVLEQFTEILERYANYHGFDDQRMLASVSNLLPRITDDSEVAKVLTYAGPNSTVEKNNFGRMDFYVHALISESTPGAVRELLSALKDVPTIDVNNYETNRRDALVFAKPFGALRDLIHDQRPGAHELLVAMNQYYEASKVEGNVTEARRVVEQAIAYCTQSTWKGNLEHVLDLSSYEEVVETPRNPNNETNLQILHRLIENTRPIPENPPEATDDWIKSQLEAYWADPTPKALATLTKSMREDLDRRYAGKEVGFEPSHIQTLAWLDNQQRKYLVGLRDNPQRLILQDPVFLESLQFMMATTDSSYDPAEFGDFAKQLQDTTIPANDRKKLYLEKVLNSLGGPIERFRAMRREDWVEALWSGNSAHEFTVLAQITDKPRVNAHEGD